MTCTSSETPGAGVATPRGKRPDSLRVELLPIPEEVVPVSLDCLPSPNIAFQDIEYSAPESLFHRTRRKILKNVSGDFYSGDLTAIMGPSGCGKTTLMNILAGYTVNNAGGKLLVNDKIRNEELFRMRSCYIMQNDNLQPLLTVHEVMTIAASLKLGTNVNQKDKNNRIQEILDSLSLWENRKVRTDQLSGGQRKRLSIALELLKNPQVMFFDEPTSGLDSSTSKQCVMLLRQLAQDGRTVICTIHQPSALLFEMFDHLYTMANGQCIYQGSIKGMLPYLEEVGLVCPPYHNPADFLMEVASGEHGSYQDTLVTKCLNGNCPDWRRKQRDTLELRSYQHIDSMMRNGLVTPVKSPSLLQFPSLRKSTNPSKRTPILTRGTYATPFYYQFYILLKRNFLILSRDRTLTYSRILTHTTVALFLGIIYYGIGADAKHMLNNSNYVFFSVLFLMMTAFMCVTTTFPSEVPIIVKEHFNRWYSVSSYYLAVTFADIPIQLIATIIYALTTFFMTSQPIEIFRLLLFVTICCLVSLVSQSFGLLIGASLDIKNGVIFGPFCFLPFVIFSGFFVQLHDAHPIMQWIFHISFLKYGFEGLMLSILGYDRKKLSCSADYCHFVYPHKFLLQMDMEEATYSTCVAFLIGLTVSIRLAAYCILRARIKWIR